MNAGAVRSATLPVPGTVRARGIMGRIDGPVEPNATLLLREDLTSTIVRFVVRPHSPIGPFVAGQYFALGLLVDGRWLMRPYSTASPEVVDDGLEFLVRLVPGGSLTPLLWRLRPGDTLRIGPAKGIFRLIEGDARDHLLISTGTGLAPFIAMAGVLRQRADRPASVIVHGVAREAELAYRQTLQGWAAEGTGTYVPAVSRPSDPANAGWRGRTGRLDAVVHDLARDGVIRPDRTVAYLCGNPAMIESVDQALRAEGVPATAILREHYWTSSPPR